MREVIISIRCDQCDASLTEKTVHEVTLTTTQEKYEADLCDPCFSEYVGQMRQVKGIKRGTRSRNGTSGPHACSQCPARFTKSAGLTRHINQKHSL